VEVKSPSPRVDIMKMRLNPKRSQTLPRMGTLNSQTDTPVTSRTSPIPMIRKGMSFPAMSSSGRMGVTLSCSMVPISFSRTTAMEVSIMVMTSRMSPSTPGTMKFRLLSSGLYQTRISGAIWTGFTPAAWSPSLLNDRVLPFFEDQEVPILRVLTDRGTEYCELPERHPYEVFLQYHEIEHTKTRARRPQSNGIYESFHKTILNEFYRVTFRKKIYQTVEELQKDLDDWLEHYNNNRTHQGKRCLGRTPMETFKAGLDLARQKNLDNGFNGVSDACQVS